jgi:tetratricopeptide (TPR) repeat protein
LIFGLCLCLAFPAYAQKAAQPFYSEFAEAENILQTKAASSAADKVLSDPTSSPDAKQEAQSRQSANTAKVDAITEKFPNSPVVLSAGSEYHLSRGNLDKAGSLAERAIGSAGPDGDPKLAAKAWTIKGLVEFQKRDYVAAYNSAKTALKGDSDFRPAFELMMYSESALHLRGMDALGPLADAYA